MRQNSILTCHGIILVTLFSTWGEHFLIGAKLGTLGHSIDLKFWGCEEIHINQYKLTKLIIRKKIFKSTNVFCHGFVVQRCFLILFSDYCFPLPSSRTFSIRNIITRTKSTLLSDQLLFLPCRYGILYNSSARVNPESTGFQKISITFSL